MPRTVLAIRLELATSGVALKLSPKRMPKKPHGTALSKTTYLVCSSGIANGNTTARQRAGWITFLAKTAHPTLQFRVKRCADTMRPVTNNAVPSVAAPRMVSPFSIETGMWELEMDTTTPSTGAQNTGFFRALQRDARVRAA